MKPTNSASKNTKDRDRSDRQWGIDENFISPSKVDILDCHPSELLSVEKPYHKNTENERDFTLDDIAYKNGAYYEENDVLETDEVRRLLMDFLKYCKEKDFTPEELRTCSKAVIQTVKQEDAIRGHLLESLALPAMVHEVQTQQDLTRHKRLQNCLYDWAKSKNIQLTKAAIARCLLDQNDNVPLAFLESTAHFEKTVGNWINGTRRLLDSRRKAIDLFLYMKLSLEQASDLLEKFGFSLPYIFNYDDACALVSFQLGLDYKNYLSLLSRKDELLNNVQKQPNERETNDYKEEFHNIVSIEGFEAFVIRYADQFGRFHVTVRKWAKEFHKLKDRVSRLEQRHPEKLTIPLKAWEPGKDGIVEYKATSYQFREDNDITRELVLSYFFLMPREQLEDYRKEADKLTGHNNEKVYEEYIIDQVNLHLNRFGFFRLDPETEVADLLLTQAIRHASYSSQFPFAPWYRDIYDHYHLTQEKSTNKETNEKPTQHQTLQL